MKNISLIAMAFILVSCPQSPDEETNETGISGPLRLWYNAPAEDWMTQALPIGNGELGAMFFGGVVNERIQFNEKTLWTGTPTERGDFQNFGNVYIDMISHGPRIRNYHRELSLADAVGLVSYTAGGIRYNREYFSSFPDKAIVMRFEIPDGERKLSFSVCMSDGHIGGEYSVTGKTIVIKGKLNTVNYEARLVVVNEGGSVAADGDRLVVTDADAVTILLAAATNYDLYNSGYIGSSAAELSVKVKTITDNASQKSYAELKESHLADYRPLFARVALDLKEGEPAMPTNELIQHRKESKYLDVLYFQFGRYLMISSSRGMNVPNNLQGIWNHVNNPPWGGDIHTNINIQMNYWPAEVANLSDCHLPFLNYIAHEALNPANYWRKLAADDGCRGWTLATQSTIFSHTDWALNRPANAWYCMHLWQHYAFTLDEIFLRDKAFPAMKSACEYWFDRLITAGDGTYEAPGEWSPEHGPAGVNGVPYAQQLIWDLFHKTLKAAEILKINDTAFIATLEEKFAKLDPGLTIGYAGHLREWKYDQNSVSDPYNEHRHLSHLIGLYPGDQIMAHTEQKYIDAVKVSLTERNFFGSGWSIAWKISCWARFHNGDLAYNMLKQALHYTTTTDITGLDIDAGVYPNLLGSCPPFQIDSNFGVTAGVAEMLIQSHLGYIELLPAIPAKWSSGSFTGLKARGNFTVDLAWENSRPVRCTVYSGSGGTCVIRYKGREVSLETNPGGNYTVNF